MTRRASATLLWFGLLVWACIILWLSSLTPQELPEPAFLFSDKINHLGAFAIGGWLAASALGVSRPSAPVVARVALAVLLIAVFGAFDEALQRFTPGRTGANLGDWIADCLGALAGALLSLRTKRLLRGLRV